MGLDPSLRARTAARRNFFFNKEQKGNTSFLKKRSKKLLGI
jgi:hypothetical protein